MIIRINEEKEIHIKKEEAIQIKVYPIKGEGKVFRVNDVNKNNFAKLIQSAANFIREIGGMDNVQFIFLQQLDDDWCDLRFTDDTVVRFRDLYDFSRAK